MDFYLNENNFIVWICVAAVLMLFFISQVRFIFKKIFSVGIGFGLIYLINILLANFCHTKKFCVGINFITVGIIFIFNCSSVFFLYLIKSLLQF